MQFARDSAMRIASHVPSDRPHLAFVNATAQGAFATLDRVAQVGTYVSSVAYANNGFAQALRAVAGAISKGVGTKVFWVQTGGYDTHAKQNTNAANGVVLRADEHAQRGLTSFYRDLDNQGLLRDTLILQFSEFGRRISENGSQGTDHGAGGLMMAIGGKRPRRHLRNRRAICNATPDNPTLENNGGDVRHETDFRSVYARVIDSWLGDATLGGDFRPARRRSCER